MVKFLKKLAIIVVLLLIVTIGVLLYTLPGVIEKSRNKVIAHSPYIISTEAQVKHDDLVIMDWHTDTMLWDRDILDRSDYGHVDIPRLNEGNVAVQMFTSVTKSPSGQNYTENTADTDTITSLVKLQLWPIKTWSSTKERALHQAARLHKYAAQAPELFRVVHNQQELRDALKVRANDKKQGKQGLAIGLLGVEGAHSLEGNLENVKTFFDAGYRMVSTNHFFDNDLGGSLHGISKEGLSKFGRDVILELDRLEIIIDLAHSSPKVVDEVLELSSRPVVVSHTGVYGACSSNRNIADEQMIRIAEKGGIIAIGYWKGAVCDITPKGIVKAIRYAIDICGENHVSLGSDFDGSTTTTLDTSELAILTQTMINEGFTDNEIRKVMGENAVNFLLNYLPK